MSDHAMLPPLSLLVIDQRLRRWRQAGALLLFVLIIAIGSIPGARAEIGHVASGIILHSLAYASITFLLYTGCSGSAAQRAFKAVLTVMVMGALDECVQSFFPYRNGTVTDWMVDTGSSLVTAGLLWALLPVPAPVQAGRA